MDTILRQQAEKIIDSSIQEMLPDHAVSQALKNFTLPSGKLFIVAVGKAAWTMANTAVQDLDRVDGGIVITKYDHVKGKIRGLQCYEAGHPIPDKNSFMATEKVMNMVSHLSSEDEVLFLLSGGGSALFEYPLIPAEELTDITQQLLASGANIVEINTIRKRLSAVKGGKFAELCKPAKVYSILLSDIVGDPLDMIASGPAYPDFSTPEEAQAIVEKYHLSLSQQARDRLKEDTPKTLDNVYTRTIGSVRNLCMAAEKECQNLGYETILLTDELTCEAREAGNFLASILRTHYHENKKLAFIAGGETVVHLTGHGKGGRNQELALAAAQGLSGLKGTAIFSVGSDGTDGPTDAAGGYVDYQSFSSFQDRGIDLFSVLKENDAYHALEAIDGLIITGPTGTNVNDFCVGLINPA